MRRANYQGLASAMCGPRGAPSKGMHMTRISTFRKVALAIVLAAASHAEAPPSAAAHSERGEDGAYVFRLDGDFFTPSAETKMKTWNFKTPEGKVFKRLVVDMTSRPPDGGPAAAHIRMRAQLASTDGGSR